jgi:hypothetical protein
MVVDSKLHALVAFLSVSFAEEAGGEIVSIGRLLGRCIFFTASLRIGTVRFVTSCHYNYSIRDNNFIRNLFNFVL